MSNTLSLKAKLLSAFGISAAILAICGIVATVSMKRIVNNYKHVAEINLGNVADLGSILATQKDMAIAISGLLGTNNTREEAERSQTLFDNASKIMDENVKAYLDIPFVEGEQERWDEVEKNLKPFRELTQKLINLSKTLRPEDRETRDKIGANELQKFRNACREALNNLIAFQEQQAKDWSGKASKTATMSQWVLLFTALFGVLFSMISGFFTARSLSNTLRGVSQRIAESADQTGSASSQLSAASQQLSSGSTEAAASLEETVSSLEELSSMVKLNADHAKEASALSQKSREAAEQGEKEIQSLIEAMAEMAKGSKKIEEIINVIDDIAFQTNLLALNAAVEAARAGEQGKGFAVVAEAVRNLAQRSASAAKDITTLIKDSVQKSENGSKIADASGEVLKNIVTSVKKVSDLNNEIASASQEQSSGISQISKAMNQLDQATQTNAASAEEVAASSEEMSSQAHALQGMVKELTVVVDGGTATTQTSPVTSTESHPKVVFMKKPAAPQKQHLKAVKDSEKEIPFEDEAPHAKVGTTDGF